MKNVQLNVFETKAEAENAHAADESKEQWCVFKQSNAENNISSAIYNPPDVSMNSEATELTFHMKFQNMNTVINNIVTTL